MANACVAAAIVSAQLRLPPISQLSLLFDGDEAIRSLNQRFRGLDNATNVLSFPGSNLSPGDEAENVLGDIAFALQTIRNEADLEGKSFDHHLSHLMIHGFLHLFGYDHLRNEEAELMEQLEIKALANLGIENPYLETQYFTLVNKE
ncbi:MAG: rRNA maturation RNase YbeY [Hyphomicrobiales bacterium]|nr:rRNA maturation RNase YbeY [Hyphomicrobiales bacterium]